MILSKKPTTIAEVNVLVPKGEEKKPIHDYLKKFSSLSKEEAFKLMEEIKSLNNPKLKEENIAKLADFLPKDLEDINKILIEAGLNEAESNAILAITKKY
jgi:DNA-directed RNA polymerase subunit F